VLWSGDSLTVITIILFLVFIGGAFAVVEKGQVLAHILATFVARFRARKYLLMAGVMFFFALCGGILGIYEEAVPLVVFVVPLAHALDWDTLVGLGMSLLALAFGFASSVTNPFTVGGGTGHRRTASALGGGAAGRVRPRHACDRVPVRLPLRAEGRA
jgi:uncharacterized ion transporter superfamily protein YfcC